MSQREISDYIAECSKSGIDNLEDICNLAKKEVESIKEFLHEADAKRIRMTFLLSAISFCSGEPVNKRKIQPIQNSYDENDEEAKILRNKICEAISINGPMTNREIIQTLGKYQEDQKVFRAVKYLGERSIIKRDGTSDNKIIPGDSWENR